VVLSVVVVEVRSQLVVAVGAAALAAIWLWLVGPNGRRLRAGWTRADHIGAIVLLAGILIVLNRIASPHATEWAKVTQNFRGRIWSYAFVSGSALAIGLGVLPAIAGLASLWIPERRTDRRWRAFAAFLGACIFTFGLYTGVKAAYLSTFFTSRVEERNLIYLAPLLLVGTVVFFSARRTWWPGVLAATAFVAWLVLGYGYQLGYPYFEAPGYGIAAFANRVFHWDQAHISNALLVTLLVAVGIVALRRHGAVIAVAVLAVAVWMCTGEITSARGSEHQAKQFVANLPHPLNWVDIATRGRGTTYLGQNIGDATGLWLIEFWNPSLKHVDSLDATAPGPGPTLTPGLQRPDGALRGDSGTPYVLADNGVQVIGPVVEQRGDIFLTRVPRHPWRLKETVEGRDPGGWIQHDGLYAYFGPERRPGTLQVDVGRTAFCAATAPGTRVVVEVGTVGLDEQNNPRVARVTKRSAFALPNCVSRRRTFVIRPPVAVHVHVTRLFVPHDYGLNDLRPLGAQVGFSFTAR
jgi:MFS family permease